MRLVGEFTEEKQAFTFSSFLHKEGINNIYEPFEEVSPPRKGFRIWVYEEDQFNRASALLDEYKQDPTHVRFESLAGIFSKPLASVEISQEFKEEEQGKALKLLIKKRATPFSYMLTNFFLLLCVFLFMWNNLQEADIIKTKGALAAEMGLTPLQEELMFDFPQAAILLGEFLQTYPIQSYHELKDLPSDARSCYQKIEAVPYWKGWYDALEESEEKKLPTNQKIPMFEKIGQGEYWRLFTPCLLHRDFLHILFNMAWLWILGRQIEERVRRYKILILFVVVGVISNVAQYLTSGPYFLGFSGIVVGMAGFIWSRQKIAPWEGYPLQKSTILFILFFVLAMFGLELVSFILQALSITKSSPNIANIAHLIGGMVGIVMGRSRFFSRGDA